MSTFINLTAHEITLENGIPIPPSGTVARVNESRKILDTYIQYKDAVPGQHWPDYTLDDIRNPRPFGPTVPVVKKKWGEVEGLPAPQHDTYYIVSAIVANACPERQDLVCPETRREPDGRVICTAFVVAARREAPKVPHTIEAARIAGLRDAAHILVNGGGIDEIDNKINALIGEWSE